MSGCESPFDHGRIAQIRELVTRWISVPEEFVGTTYYTIPATPDDVFYLCDLAEAMAELLVAADAEVSHARYRGSLASESHEVDALIARIRQVTG